MAAIPNPHPTIIPARAEVVYDKYWITLFKASALDPAKPVALEYHVHPARQLEDGSFELDRVNGPFSRVIEDVFLEAQTDAVAADVMTRLFTWIAIREAQNA
jgi:hypothetical protein